MVAIWVAVLAAGAIGVLIGIAIGIYIERSRTETLTRPVIKKILIIIAVAIIAIAGLLIVLTDTTTDPPSEIWCEPPLKNYNSVCSCGPDMEIVKEPGGTVMCKPISR